MGFRFRKSYRIFPGVRINLSKTGIGASLGFKGFRLTKRADGKIQKTFTLPGTGISYVDTDIPDKKSPATTRGPKVRAKTAQCVRCKSRYRIGKVQFCSKCGHQLN